ncbi:Fe-S oxidoreductase [Shewanella submarina]|uniref:Heterodisulfide reductase-related iron-sulfur binding cluster n=1 Tax=Shewanella submarina TaxID=2016376 RepID=A0ABV7GG43_9GAMM|nr:heterodisulfide reductase-related iron-sulfur binding cluster [Shewanella submarina]MCL1036603.1 Fe-S oxidoreductase [Shewanella submarina]
MSKKEGSLEAPTRHPIAWQTPEFYDREALNKELERVYDICHGCRRCVSLCNAFPVLFDLVDESETMEVDGVDKADYHKVVDQCYLCDMCYMSKCPYVPPHEWQVDFPHLMLRAKAVHFQEQGARFRDKLITSTDTMGKMASTPVISAVVNASNKNGLFRKALESSLGIHHEAPLPGYDSNTLRKRARILARPEQETQVNAIGETTAKVALYATCYGNYNSPYLAEDFFKVFQHNDIHLEVVPKEQCCGMPKLELGDFESVAKLKQANIPVLAKLVDEGFDIIAPVPSCVLMYKQELPLMFPDDPDVLKVQRAMYDPFEYLFLRHKGSGLKLDFKQGLGDISYHVACHLRVQNIGLKTRDVLALIPDTNVNAIERCSGHDGTYAVKVETRDASVKIARPVVRKLEQLNSPHVASDCPMAATHITHLSKSGQQPVHPMTLLRQAYGL